MMKGAGEVTAQASQARSSLVIRFVPSNSPPTVVSDHLWPGPSRPIVSTALACADCNRDGVGVEVGHLHSAIRSQGGRAICQTMYFGRRSGPPSPDGVGLSSETRSRPRGPFPMTRLSLSRVAVLWDADPDLFHRTWRRPDVAEGGARPKALRRRRCTGVSGVRASQDAYPKVAPISGRNGSSHSFKKSPRCSFACRTVSQPPWSAKRSP